MYPDNGGSKIPLSVNPKMEEAKSYEKSLHYYKTTRRHVPEDNICGLRDAIKDGELLT
jgi:hypothetical protein